MIVFMIVGQSLAVIAGVIVAVLAARHRLRYAVVAGAGLAALGAAHLFTHHAGIDWIGPWLSAAQIALAWSYAVSVLRGWRRTGRADRISAACFGYFCAHMAALFSGRPAFATGSVGVLVLFVALFLFCLFYLPYSFVQFRRIERHAEAVLAELADLRATRDPDEIERAPAAGRRRPRHTPTTPAIRRILGMRETRPDQR